MALSSFWDDDDDEEEYEAGISGADKDSALDEDIEALKRACMLTGRNPIEIGDIAADSNSGSDGSDEIDDLELVRSIQERFSLPLTVNSVPGMSKSSIFRTSTDSDDEDDFETLRAIQRRFAKYESSISEKDGEKHLLKAELAYAISTPSKQETPIVSFESETNSKALGEEFPDSDDNDTLSMLQPLGSFFDGSSRNQPSGFIEWHRPEVETCILSAMPLKTSTFPKSGQMFIDAIKKNRACQKFIRSKLIEIEAKIEGNKELKGRIKCLVDFQASCKRKAGQVFCQKKDARFKLISLPKSKKQKEVKGNNKKIPVYFGPNENSHVSNYQMVLTKFGVSLSRQPWSKLERENLAKGIKQQFQQMLLQKSMDFYRSSEESSRDSSILDDMITSITDLEITSENFRSFLPQVDWEKLASMYVMGRSGAECEARWLNIEDPMINHNPWTNLEDKNLLFVAQKRGIYNWIDIAITLGTNRTPFQSLARYQRSLNAYIMKKDWTEDEDAQLRIVVEALGEGNWQLVASNLEGRKGVQCSNRWRKSLNPRRQKVGRWALEEDKRLKVAVMLLGPKTWKKIAQFVPGRTEVQCRERWFNVLDPSLNLKEWTEEEDSKLKAAIAEHGHCWSKVALFVPHRTDNQCRRRWKVLLPHEVPLLQAARKIQKAALISNFVDREGFRSGLGPSDFLLPAPEPNSLSEAENGDDGGKQKKITRKMQKTKKGKDPASCNVPQKIRSKKPRTKAKTHPGEILRAEGDNIGNDTISKERGKKRSPNSLSRSTKSIQPAGNKNQIDPSHAVSDTINASSHAKLRTEDVTQQARSKISRDKGEAAWSISKTTDDDTVHGPVSDNKMKRKHNKVKRKPKHSENEIVPEQAVEAFPGKKKKTAGLPLKRCRLVEDEDDLPLVQFLTLKRMKDQDDLPLAQFLTLKRMDIGNTGLNGVSRSQDCPKQASSGKSRTTEKSRREEISSTSNIADSFFASTLHKKANISVDEFSSRGTVTDQVVETFATDISNPKELGEKEGLESVSMDERVHLIEDHGALPHQDHLVSEVTDTNITSSNGNDMSELANECTVLRVTQNGELSINPQKDDDENRNLNGCTNGGLHDTFHTEGRVVDLHCSLVSLEDVPSDISPSHQPKDLGEASASALNRPESSLPDGMNSYKPCGTTQFLSGQCKESEQADISISVNAVVENMSPLVPVPDTSAKHQDTELRRSRRGSRKTINYEDMLEGAFQF